MAGYMEGADRQKLRAIHIDGIRLPGGIEGDGVVLEMELPDMRGTTFACWDEYADW